MHFASGNCGHLKAKWDNHPSCLSCTACLRNSPCSLCSVWSNKVWNLAEKRLYTTRKSVMMQRRNQKKNKKLIQSDLSDTGSHDGSIAPYSYTAQGRTHQGGSPGYQVSNGALSPRSVTCQPVTCQPITGHPVTGQPVMGHPVTSQPITGHPVTSLPVTGQLVTGQPGTSQPGTDHPGTSQQPFTLDFLSPVNISLVIVPQHSYAPSVSSHVSHGSKRRLPNIQHAGYELSERTRVPKSSYFI